MCTCLSEYAAYRRARGDGQNTIRSRVGAVRRCAAAAGVEECALTTLDMINHLDRLLSPQTRQCYVVGLRAWGEWLVKNGYRTASPAADLPRPRVPRGVPRPVPESAIQPLLDRASPRVRAMLALAAYAGLRTHEIAKIRGEDVDCETLYVRGKGGKDAMLPTHPMICRSAQVMPSDGFWFPSSIAGESMRPRSVGRLMTRAMREAGVAGSPHQLRHRYGTAVLKGSGGNLRVAQELLRHSSPATTAIYTMVEDSEKRSAVLALA